MYVTVQIKIPEDIILDMQAAFNDVAGRDLTDNEIERIFLNDLQEDYFQRLRADQQDEGGVLIDMISDCVNIKMDDPEEN